MILKIFIDKQNFDCLKRSLPAGSIGVAALNQAVHIANIISARASSNAVVTCDDVEARDLLTHARSNCPGAVAAIAEAIRAAGLTP